MDRMRKLDIEALVRHLAANRGENLTINTSVITSPENGMPGRANANINGVDLEYEFSTNTIRVLVRLLENWEGNVWLDGEDAGLPKRTREPKHRVLLNRYSMPLIGECERSQRSILHGSTHPKICAMGLSFGSGTAADELDWRIRWFEAEDGDAGNDHFSVMMHAELLPHLELQDSIAAGCRFWALYDHPYIESTAAAAAAMAEQIDQAGRETTTWLKQTQNAGNPRQYQRGHTGTGEQSAFTMNRRVPVTVSPKARGARMIQNGWQADVMASVARAYLIQPEHGIVPLEDNCGSAAEVTITIRGWRVTLTDGTEIAGTEPNASSASIPGPGRIRSAQALVQLKDEASAAEQEQWVSLDVLFIGGAEGRSLLVTDDFTGDAETLTNILMHVDERAGMRQAQNIHDHRYHARLQALEAMGEFDELCQLEVQRAALMLENNARYDARRSEFRAETPNAVLTWEKKSA